jgi:site-specific DNA recombinase
MNTTPLSVGFYARVSSEKQARERTIDSQLAELGVRARTDGVEAPPELIFIDDGYSGAELLRPALERLRDTAAAGALDRLYTLCPDRLARDFAHQILLIDELHRAGVEVVFLNHHLDDSPEGKLLRQIQGVIAKYERSKIRECARRGRMHAARSGALSVLASAPYGYRYITKSDGGGQSAYQIVLDEARVVRQIFDWVGRDGCSLVTVVRRLKTQGIPTSTGKPVWDRATLRDMLQNAAYKGAAEYGKTRRVERRARLRPRRGQPEFPRRNRCSRDTTADERIPIPSPRWWMRRPSPRSRSNWHVIGSIMAGQPWLGASWCRGCWSVPGAAAPTTARRAGAESRRSGGAAIATIAAWGQMLIDLMANGCVLIE